MIISHQHKFIFIKTRKTAGTSMECALSAICGADDVVTPISELHERSRMGNVGPQNYRYIPSLFSPEWPFHIKRFLLRRKPRMNYYDHFSASQIKERISGNIWNSYYKFAFDRNPWDREFSWYSHITALGRQTGNFEAHLKKLPDAKLDNYNKYSIDGTVVVDFVGRYENLQKDLNMVMSEVGAKSLPPVPVTYQHSRKDRRHYRELYNETTRDLIAQTYPEEIELLGYTF